MRFGSFRIRRHNALPPVMTANRYLLTNLRRAVGIGAMVLAHEAHTALSRRQRTLT